MERWLQDLIQQELRPGETILWTGQPAPRRIARMYWLSPVFGLLWAALNGHSLISLITAIMHDEPIRDIPFFIVSILFTAMSIPMLCLPFWAAYRAKKTVYAVTNRRALILLPSFWSIRTVAFGPRQIAPMDIVVRRDRTGDIVFGAAGMFRQWIKSDSSEDRKRYEFVKGFMGIPDVRNVQNIIEDMLRKHDLAPQQILRPKAPDAPKKIVLPKPRKSGKSDISEG